MHVAIDASSWENERGFGRFTRSLIEALAARDAGIRYTLLFDQPPERPVPQGVRARVAGTGAPMSEATSGKRARAGGDMLSMGRAARDLAPDVFFYPASYSWFPLLSRTPTVVCIHDTIPERFPDLIFPAARNRWLWTAKTWAAKTSATRILTVSKASADDISAILRVPRDRIDITTEGASETFRVISEPGRGEATRARFGLPPGDPFLLYVGGFNRHKNVIRLIDAMPAILAACPAAHLVIVGRTDGARFWDNVDELRAGASRTEGLMDRILFTGEIDDDVLALMMNEAAALVMPSLWEGFGLPALEAMSCGTPVLASTRGSLPEVVGEAGLYFDPERADELAAAAIRLLTDKGLAADLSAKALARAKTFSWDAAARLAEESFRRALGSRAARG
ncbi:MAG: glycosyltransferase family 4 protein [Paracoccaceae bacterium]